MPDSGLSPSDRAGGSVRQVDFDRSGLEAYGFVGFLHVHELRHGRCVQIPDVKGVYVVYRENADRHGFLRRSLGGHYKGEDPTVSLATLRDNWVDGAQVLNFGKAGGFDPNKGRELYVTLRSRVKELVSFAYGNRVAHRGGKMLWQVKGCHDFLVGWKGSTTMEPYDEEGFLIEQFRKAYGSRPFANGNR